MGSSEIMEGCVEREREWLCIDRYIRPNWKTCQAIDNTFPIKQFKIVNDRSTFSFQMIIGLSQVSSTIGNGQRVERVTSSESLFPTTNHFRRTLKRENARSRKKRPGMWRNVQSRLTSWKIKMVKNGPQREREWESGRIACHAWTLFCSWGVTTIQQL